MLDDSHNFPATISANSNIDYCLSFESDKAGKYSDNLVITSNDPNIGIIKIPIAAEVKEPTSSVIDFSDTDEFTLSVESNINDLVVSLTSENELLSGRLSVHDINGLRLYEKSLSNDKSETIILDANNIGRTIFITYLHNGITYTYKHINI